MEKEKASSFLKKFNFLYFVEMKKKNEKKGEMTGKR